MNEECLICKAPLEYLKSSELMECAICHRKESSSTRCVNGHYVCNDCHTRGIDTIIGICLNTDSKDPIEIIRMMMAEPFCHIIKEHFGVDMEKEQVVCTHSHLNNQCIGSRCPFKEAG